VIAFDTQPAQDGFDFTQRHPLSEAVLRNSAQMSACARSPVFFAFALCLRIFVAITNLEQGGELTGEKPIQ
jgi:hypothetical protein